MNNKIILILVLHYIFNLFRNYIILYSINYQLVCMDSDLEVDFNIVVSIPTTQNTGKGSKQVTLYLLVVEATSTCSGKIWQWKKVRRYSEFYGLYQRVCFHSFS